MSFYVYLSGEIHTDWRDRIIEGAQGLDITFSAPVTDHAASDDAGAIAAAASAHGRWFGGKRGRKGDTRAHRAASSRRVVGGLGDDGAARRVLPRRRRHARARHRLEEALDLGRAAREALGPEVVARVLDELDERDE